MSDNFEQGQRIRLPGRDGFVTIDDAQRTSRGWRSYVQNESSEIRRIEFSDTDAGRIEVVTEDGGSNPAKLLAALWTEWMRAATVAVGAGG